MSDSVLREKPDANKPTTGKSEVSKPDIAKPLAGEPDAGKSTTNRTKTNEPEAEFTTKNIGKWASRQENPFAEQNRKAAAKKQKANEARKKATPFVAIIAAIITVGVAIFGLVMLVIGLINSTPEAPEPPTIAGDSAQDLNDYQDILNNLYNQRPDASVEDRLQDVQNTIDNTLKTESGKEYANQVLLAQAMFYFDNSMYDRVVNVSQQVDENKLSDENKLLYYNIAYYSYERIGNPDMANEFLNKAYVLSDAMSGNDFEYYETE